MDTVANPYGLISLWGQGDFVTRGISLLLVRIAEAKAEPQPELHLRADRKTPYERVAQVMAAAQSGCLSKIGFITEPAP